MAFGIAAQIALLRARVVVDRDRAAEREARLVERIAAPADARQQQRGAGVAAEVVGVARRARRAGTAARRPSRWRRRPGSRAAGRSRSRASPARPCGRRASAAWRRRSRAPWLRPASAGAFVHIHRFVELQIRLQSANSCNDQLRIRESGAAPMRGRWSHLSRYTSAGSPPAPRIWGNSGDAPMQ